MTRLSLTPLYRHSVGFEHLNNLLDSMMNTEEQTNAYPPYNIEKLGDEKYRITMAVAGFSQKDIQIMLHNGTLTVVGKSEKTEEAEQPEYLYKGIATRNFERKFNLADHIKVLDADLSDGLLKINLAREVPEEAKPRLIAINTLVNGAKKAIEKKEK